LAESILQKRYDPKKTESKWYEYWLEKEYFKADPSKDGPVFSIVIPPPNVTGELHIGHLLPMTLQDVMIRYKKLRGYNTLWLPGTDHASIATHTMIEKQLEKEGIKRKDFTREKFLERAWQWKEQYGNRIIHQLKRFGVACDWTRERFTMDEGLSNAVREVFVRLYEEGLIYRGTYLVNWCPRCATAVSDLEVEHEETTGKLYYLKYPVKDTDKYVTVATTRPETMLGDTAVAINPEDDRHSWLLDKTIILPIIGRELKVISDPVVDPEFGTGIVKVTPAHDPNDYKLGHDHDLEQVNILNDDGTMNENAGPYKGIDRFECRKAVIERLKEEELLEKTENHKLAIGHCQRCETVVEPLISEQWFVKIKPIADEAIRVVENGDIEFIPEMWKKVYFEWMYNIRDWCISRQLWWGHRIPVWYCSDCKGETCTINDPDKCKHCGSTNIHQDEDILDTWFSSGLWPFSTMGWPEETPDLKTYYPTSILITAFDIIFFWVARMIMMGMKFMKQVPFKIAYFHGLICDETGAKMGRTKGNAIEPVEIVDLYGTDAVRFSLSVMAMPGRRDIPLSMDRIEGYRNFANKLWNAARFVLMNIEDHFEFKSPETIEIDKIPFESRWILDKFNHLIQKVTTAMESLDFHIATDLIYKFLWHEYCDWYIEMAKPTLYQKEDLETKNITHSILLYILEKSVKLLHPFMPFITEEIWQSIPYTGESIMISDWPIENPEFFNTKIGKEMDLLMDLITTVRNIRGEMNINPAQKIDLIINIQNNSNKVFIEKHSRFIALLAKTNPLKFSSKKPEQAAVGVCNEIEVFIPLGEIINFSEEKNRLQKEIGKLDKELEFEGKKLQNTNFLSKAPKEVVQKVKKTHEQYLEEKKKLIEALEKLEKLC